MSTGYKEILENDINLLVNEKKPVIVFGAKATGIMCIKALKKLKKEIVFFCDNDKSKQGTSIQETEILSPVEAFDLYPDATVYIALLRKENIDIVTEQLKGIGYSDIRDKDPLMYVFQTQVISRPFSSEKTADTLYKIKTAEKHTIFISMGAFITERCNLNCKNCGYFIPYYKNPKNFDKNLIIESIKKLSESIDALVMLTILGGETLLYPENELVEICEFAYSLPNILMVRIVTNATVAPSDSYMKRLKKCLTHMNYSDYGQMSKRKAELCQRMDQNEIVYDIAQKADVWFPLEAPKDYGRTEAEKQTLFEQCCLEKDILYKGSIHKCGFSIMGVEQGFIKKDNDEYVNLLDDSISTGQMKDKINDYIANNNYLEACNYCGYKFEQTAPRAEQINKRLEWSNEIEKRIQ